MEREVLNVLYSRYQRELHRYLLSLCKNKEQAEDLLQETFLKALLALPPGHSNVKAWLYMVARNLFFNQQKKAKCIVELDAASELAEEAASAADLLILDEKKRMLYRALSQLEARRREVIEMQYFDGFSQKEIAAILQITPENVRILAYRAKKDLKKYLEENGYDVS